MLLFPFQFSLFETLLKFEQICWKLKARRHLTFTQFQIYILYFLFLYNTFSLEIDIIAKITHVSISCTFCIFFKNQFWVLSANNTIDYNNFETSVEIWMPQKNVINQSIKFVTSEPFSLPSGGIFLLFYTAGYHNEFDYNNKYWTQH